MDIVATLYEAAANAGLLKECVWRPSDGGPPRTNMVGFAAPDETLLDGLTVSTEYVMSYPATIFAGLGPRETVEIAVGSSTCGSCVRSATAPRFVPSSRGCNPHGCQLRP